MTSHHAAPPARERQRFLRPDFARYLKPDWRDRKYWRVPPPDWAEHPDDVHFAQARSPDGAERHPGAPLKSASPDFAALNPGYIAEFEALRREQAELKRLLAEVKLDLLLRRVVQKYRPDQPRVPAGNPDGGQWTTEGGQSTTARGESTSEELTDFSAARRGRGHHQIPRAVFEKRKLSDETRKVFEDASTGPLRDSRSNKYDTHHRHYNDAVDDLFNRFLKENGITEEQMTSDQARALHRQVLESRDPRIRNYNMHMLLREIMKRGPLRPRGNE